MGGVYPGHTHMMRGHTPGTGNGEAPSPLQPTRVRTGAWGTACSRSEIAAVAAGKQRPAQGHGVDGTGKQHESTRGTRGYEGIWVLRAVGLQVGHGCGGHQAGPQGELRRHKAEEHLIVQVYRPG